MTNCLLPIALCRLRTQCFELPLLALLCRDCGSSYLRGGLSPLKRLAQLALVRK